MNKLKKLKLIHVIFLCYTLLILAVFAIVGIAYAGTQNRARNGLLISEQTAPANPPSGWGSIYVADDGGTMTLYFKDDTPSATNLLTVSGRSLDEAYDDGGSGTGKTIAADSGAVTINNTDADNANNLTVNKSPSGAASGYAIGIVSGANCTGSSVDIANAGSGYDIDGTSSTWYVTSAGAITCASLTATTNYMTALAAAASGNINLTIDAAGTGTITLGSTSTGRIINTVETDFLGTVDIGDAATDTLTIISIIDGDLTLDDNSGASPSFIMKDATGENATFSKTDSGYMTITTQAADGVQILTGSLKIGNAGPGSAPDGEDLYVEGTVEVDGAVTLDGALTCNSTMALSENVTFTMANDEYMLLDAQTTAMVQTAGVLDINLKNAATNVKGISILMEAEDTFADFYGLYIDISDDTSGGQETVHAIYITNSLGTAGNTRGIDIDNKVDDGIYVTVGAAMQAIVIDASTDNNTGMSGVIDINYDTTTDTASAININMAVPAGGSDADDYSAILIDLTDNSDASADIIGIKITSSDVAGSGGTKVIGFYTSGLDQAFQADGGYFRLGTGSTPSQTLGDDDGFVEGHWEVDGDLHPHGNVVGDGATKIYGVVSDVSACVSSDTLLISELGMIFINDGAGGTVIEQLPTAASAIGGSYTFVVTDNQTFRIDPDGVEQIIGHTSAGGDYLESSQVGDSITITALKAAKWAVTSVGNATNQSDAWTEE